MLSLRFGPVEEFGLLKGALREAGYSEAAVCARLGLGALHELVGKINAAWPDPGDRDALGILIKLFLLNHTVHASRLEASVAERVVNALKNLGLLLDGPSNAGSLRASAALYPAFGLYFVSDLWINVEGSSIEPLEDIVFPAITPHTFEFMATLPDDPCECFLDLCSGTGVAALVAASRYARRACAVDITERATRCAEFSRMLNGLENVTVIQGNLYEPLKGETFDRIVAHPPYVPALKPGKIYYDGGEDGERVTRAIVEGVTQHLDPRGRLYCLAMTIEREGEPFEQRARQWMGRTGADFDVLYVVHMTQGLKDFAYQAAVRVQGDKRVVEEWKAHFKRLRVKDLVFGALVIQRKDGPRPPFTLRRQRGRRSGAAETAWLMRWETASREAGSRERLLASKPVFSRELELQVRHCFQGAELAPVEFTLQTDYPFAMESQIQPWMAMMVARCDGSASAAEIFESCKQDQLIHPQTPVDEFLQLLRTFIAGGFLQVCEFPLPQKATERPAQ